MSGVPASDTSAIFAPCLSLARIAGRTRCRIMLVIGFEWGREAVMRKKPPRHPSILGEHDIGTRERRERAQRHVAEIADGRRDDVKPCARASPAEGSASEARQDKRRSARKAVSSG